MTAASKASVMKAHMTGSYQDAYHRWRRDPEGFWAEAAQDIDWFRPATKVFDPAAGVHGRWFAGAVCNTCFNAVDRHVIAGRGPQPAIIYDSPLAGIKRTFSYAELLDEVSTFAAVLQDLGAGHGDRVIIYMPAVPEAAIAMLACARIGAIHSAVFGGLAAKELASRIDNAKPRLVLSASCGIEPGCIVNYKNLLDEAISLSKAKPQACIILQRPHAEAAMIAGRDHDWEALRRAAITVGKRTNCAALAATDPLYILYTSGTAGQPKGIVRDNGGHMVALKWSMKYFYGVEPGEVYWAASDIGWVVGHSYSVYAPLLHGATTILYEGTPVSTPDAGAFWRVIAEHGCVAMQAASTEFHAIKKEDPEGKHLRGHNLSKFRALFLVGERAYPNTVMWAERILKVPVIDHWWQTETGWPIAGNPLGLGMLPVKHGSLAVAMPGYQVDIAGEAAKPLPPNVMGSIVIKLPLPPGCLTTLWQQDEHFCEDYFTEFPGYYNTGDTGFKDEDGRLNVMGRTDDIINVAGHLLSASGIEEVLASHPDVAECAVIGANDKIKGEVPCGFVVLKAGVIRPPSIIEKEIAALAREKAGPAAAFSFAIAVNRLPKTRSGKILRSTLKEIADGDAWTMLEMIGDPAILDEITAALKAHGLEVALRASEEFSSTVLASSADCIKVLDCSGRVEFINEQGLRLLETDDPAIMTGKLWPDMWPEKERPIVQAAIDKANAGETGHFSALYPTAKGTPKWWDILITPMRDSEGRIHKLVATTRDITGAKEAEEQIKLLLCEVNHRAKNMLSVVEAIARQTAAANPDDFIESFAERVQALSASQDLLVKNEWRGVDLHKLALSQLGHFKDLIDTRIELRGPPLLVSASAAQALGMALHELATNAGKYGALSDRSGRIELCWSLEPGDGGGETFVISWHERGGPSVRVPASTGFGSVVLCRVAKQSLNAQVELDYASRGLVWRLQCPAREVMERPAVFA
jgi:propionyl-CoA synthetase